MRILLFTATAATLVAACNKAPEGVVVVIEPEAPSTLDDLAAVLTADAVDPNGDVVAYRYVWSVDGEIQDDLDSDSVPAERTRRDELWSVQVFPADDKLEGAPAVAERTVLNTPPTVTIQLSPMHPRTEDDLVVSAITDDVDGDPVELSWAWTVDASDARIDGPQVDAASTRKGQRWEVTVLPTDGTDEGEAQSAGVEIGNTAPSLTEAVLDPAEAFEDSVIRAGYDAYDIDGDDLVATYTWFVDGGEVAVPGDSLTGEHFDKGDQVRVEIVVNDGLADSVPQISEPVFVLNSPPSIDAAIVSPSEVTELTEVSCTAEGWRDADGDEAQIVIAWEVDGRRVSAEPTLTGVDFSRGNRVVCVATPFDGDDYGEPVRSVPVTVRNAPPVLDGVRLDPAVPKTDESVTAVPGTITDADGDRVSVTYSWTVDGRGAGSGSVLASSAHEKGSKIVVTATPNDGRDSGRSVTAAATTGNTPPTVTSVVISPSTLRTADTARVSYAVSDADGDSVSVGITWKVNGVSRGTGSSLGSSNFQKGDRVTVDVVPHDGTDPGPGKTGTRTVENTAPTAPAISLTPTSPSTSSTLVCRVSTVSTDPDSDTITYTYTWRRNGTTYTTVRTTGTTSSISSSATAPGQTWSCTVSASDGTESSGSVVSTVTITGATVPGFSGVLGPTFTGWTQCEGYLDKSGGDDIPTAWGDDCTSSSYNKVRLVCGASTSSYRYIDVKKNVFRLGLSAYPETGLITAARNQSGTSFTIDNKIYATANDIHNSRSWWNGGDGCGETNTNITFNNVCTYEASNCFGQGITGSRYVFVYVAP